MKNPWKIEKRQFIFDIIWEEWKTHWPSGQSTRLRVERSGFETCAGSMCCVLRQNTLPPQCFSSLRSIDGYRRIVTETWWNARGLPCNGPITHPGGGGEGVVILLSLRYMETGISYSWVGQWAWLQTLLLIKDEESRKMNICTCCSQLYKHYSWLLMIRTFQNTIVFFFLVRCLFKSVRLL